MPKIHKLSDTFVTEFRMKYQNKPLQCCEIQQEIGLSKGTINPILLNQRHYVRKNTFDKLNNWLHGSERT